MDPIDSATVWVVLSPPGSRLEETLRGRLEDGGSRIIECEEPEMAMAELCLLERGERSRAAWGLEPAPPVGLVVVDPETRPEWICLRQAVIRYLPRTAVYVSRGRHLEQERRATAAPVDAAVTGDEIAMLLEPPGEEP